MGAVRRPSGGVVAAGHPVTAETGAAVLRDGGNAVDAALAAMLASWVCEPLLTGPGSGGYLMVAGAGREPVLLDFFVAAPGHGADPSRAAPLEAVTVSFGEAEQTFHCGAASVGVPGTPAGIAAAHARWGSGSLADLAAPAAKLAREGVPVAAQQAFVFDLLEGILVRFAEGRAVFTPTGDVLREGDSFASEDLAATIERLGADGDRPFYEGDLAGELVRFLDDRGGLLTRDDLRAYRAVEREPVRVGYRRRTILTNPPPSAGGTLIALALGLLERAAPGDPAALVEAMARAQDERSDAFVEGLAEGPPFARRFLADRLGSTTHVSTRDADGLVCAVTCTNGEGCGLVVPGLGIHPNNIMGEEDLNPRGFGRTPPGTRMPSMMAPTVVLDPDGEVELALGSAGSNRIRSAITQVIRGVLDDGRDVVEAVEAPRLHLEDGVLYAEPGAAVPAAHADAAKRFAAPNLFFGGCQAVTRDGRGAGDPRRGGAVAYA